MVHLLILGFNKFRYKDGKGDPKGFVSALETSRLPKGDSPTVQTEPTAYYVFNITGKLHAHEAFFTKLNTLISHGAT